jgi:hypothetical protein
MVDEEDDTKLTEEEQRALAPKSTGAHIFYGSLEHREKERLEALKKEPAKKHDGGEPAGVVFEAGDIEEESEEEEEEATGIQAGIAAGNISVADESDVMELSEQGKAAKERQVRLFYELHMFG